jgi:hypothetical protein
MGQVLQGNRKGYISLSTYSIKHDQDQEYTFDSQTQINCCNTTKLLRNWNWERAIGNTYTRNAEKRCMMHVHCACHNSQFTIYKQCRVSCRKSKSNNEILNLRWIEQLRYVLENLLLVKNRFYMQELYLTYRIPTKKQSTKYTGQKLSHILNVDESHQISNPKGIFRLPILLLLTSANVAHDHQVYSLISIKSSKTQTVEHTTEC